MSLILEGALVVPPLLSAESIGHLVGSGWCCQPLVEPASASKLLSEDCYQLFESRRFEPARIGSGVLRKVQTHIRSDKTCWWDPLEPTDVQTSFLVLADQLRLQLNRELFTALHDLEVHYAIYPPGGQYSAHLDQLNSRSNRVISMVYYMNENWRSKWGGQLRIHEAERYQDIEPLAGTLVLFRSDSILHEVLPTSRQRLSISGWFRN